MKKAIIAAAVTLLMFGGLALSAGNGSQATGDCPVECCKPTACNSSCE